MIRSEYGVVPPETVAETVVPLATTTDPEEITGRFFGTGREEVDVPEGVRDSDRRRRLWAVSEEVSGLAERR